MFALKEEYKSALWHKQLFTLAVELNDAAVDQL